MRDRLLIDTSVWIAYFRGRDESVRSKVETAMSSMDVYVPKIVIAELIQGAKSEKEVSAIGEFLEAFNIVDQSEDTWLRAGRLSFMLKRKGVTVHLTDCYIAEIAIENNCKIFTQDEHFKVLKRFGGVALAD